MVNQEKGQISTSELYKRVLRDDTVLSYRSLKNIVELLAEEQGERNISIEEGIFTTNVLVFYHKLYHKLLTNNTRKTETPSVLEISKENDTKLTYVKIADGIEKLEGNYTLYTGFYDEDNQEFAKKLHLLGYFKNLNPNYYNGANDERRTRYSVDYYEEVLTRFLEVAKIDINVHLELLDIEHVGIVLGTLEDKELLDLIRA